MPESKSNTKATNRLLITLIAAVFAPMLGTGIVAPLLPIYARDFGASGLTIGLLFASFSISRTYFLPRFSRLSDKKGRRQFLIIGLVAHSLCSVAYIWADSAVALILVRLVHGVPAAMIWPIASAYVGDIAPPGQEGRFMGLFNLGIFGGLAAGPLLGGLIKDAVGMEAAFILMGLMALGGLIPVLFFLPRNEPHRVKPVKEPPRIFEVLKTYKVIRALFLYRLGGSLVVAVIWAFQPLYLDTTLHLSASLIGLLLTLNVALSTILQAPMGRLADRISRRAMLVTACLIQAGTMFMMPLAMEIWSILAINLAVGVAGGIAAPTLQAVVTTEGRSAKIMGTFMGTLFSAQSLGMFVGPIFAGLLFQSGDFVQLFWITGVLVMLSLIPIMAYLPGGRKKDG